MAEVELVKHMVQRFLSWKLPDPFRPDNGIKFNPPFPEEPMRSRHWPVGTNLLDANQAEAMVRHMLDDAPSRTPRLELSDENVEILAELLAEQHRRTAYDPKEDARAILTALQETNNG